MDIEIYQAFVSAGAAPADAKAVVKAMDKHIDECFSTHTGQSTSNGDLLYIPGVLKTHSTQMEARLLAALKKMQYWTITAIFVAMAAVVILAKIWL